jgi:hypothetical protein
MRKASVYMTDLGLLIPARCKVLEKGTAGRRAEPLAE